MMFKNKADGNRSSTDRLQYKLAVMIRGIESEAINNTMR